MTARTFFASITGLAMMAALPIAPAGTQPPDDVGGPLAAAGEAPADALTPETDEPATVEPMLQREFEEAGSTDFWIRFDESADLEAASQIEDWAERGTAVAAALRDTAAATQADVRAHLDGQNVDYEAFWATNAIYVEDGDAELAQSMTSFGEVSSLVPAQEYEPPKLEESDVAQTLSTVEWGIAAIKANDVWSQYDVRGEGIVVANIDSGVQYDHPALVEKYRGNNGDGTFSHDYNWFDAYGYCTDGAPCDVDGHGTHTMGTMAGSDGDANQIGVAPDVTWIAANGCCTSDAGLIASAQWMLEPTDANGQNPDASKRPHVVNNSWGSEYPSVQPFLEDIMIAWEKSGIMGIWSNGNAGPGCRTSGAPGSRIINYSVGAFSADGSIAGFSSRGVGQDGEIKPNIAAPGVGIRSSVPGGYFAAEGTSMAAPHVAGTVALLWSAAPGLVGDIANTRALLDGSAADAPDDQCGGTSDNGNDDNNVFGEGRLDALALLDAAPVGGTGTLDATFTDAATGDPIVEATITVEGPVNRERVTGDGQYSMLLPPGDYSVTVQAYGYASAQVEVTIATEQTVEQAFALEPVPSVEVAGQVVDGSGHDWPLYAKVTVDGMPGDGVFTNPEDGRFSVTIPAGEPQTVTVDPVYDGYLTSTDEVTVTADDPTLQLDVPVDIERCPAEVGYEFAYDGVFADFESQEVPEGWEVVDHSESGMGWRFDNPRDRDNWTGGTGNWAEAGMLSGAPVGTVVDSSLVTPSVDLSDQDSPVLMFQQEYAHLGSAARVELSLDGGQTWETLLEQTVTVPGRQDTIPLPQAAGESDVRVRFRLSDAKYSSRYWQVDDVLVGSRTCVPVPGGLVIGQVTDRNTGDLVPNAVVTSEDGASTGVATTTPDDPAVDDAFYWLFAAHTRTHGFTAQADMFEPHSQVVRVRPNTANTRDFKLPAGELVIEQDEVTADIAAAGPRSTARRTFTVSNTGSAPATLEFHERGDQNPIPRSDDGTWVDIPEYPIPIADNIVAEHDGKVYSLGGYTYNMTGDTAESYVYDPAVGEWAEIAPLPEIRKGAAAEFVGDLLYVFGGWGPDARAQKTMFVYDPATDTWSTAAEGIRGMSAMGHAMLDGKLYYVGGCSNNCVHSNVQRYDPATDTWDEPARYPEAAAHLACGGIDGVLYCAGGVRTSASWAKTFAYDPATDTWTQKADMPIQLWGMAYTVSSGRLVVAGGLTGGAPDVGQPATPSTVTNRSFSYDPRTDTWSPLHPSGDARYRGGGACGLYRIGGAARNGGSFSVESEMLPTYGDCEPTDVPWMSLDTDTVTIDPGKKVKITVTYDAAGMDAGQHEAGVWIWQDTPYLQYPVDVTMNVTS